MIDREYWNNFHIPTWSVVAFGTLYAYYKYCTWHFGTFKKLGIKGPRPYPVVGTLLPLLRKGVLVYDTELRQKYGSVVGTFTGRMPVLVIFDVNILKQILVKDFSNFANRFDLGISEYPLGKILPALKDEQWKYVRNHLAPTFSSGKLRKMNDKMLCCIETFVRNLEKMAESGEVFDFRLLCGAFSMDAIASTAFGLQIDSHNDPKNQFVRMANKVFEFNFASLKSLIIFFLPFLIKPLGKLGFSVFPKDSVKFFVSVIDQAMSERRGIENDDIDFLQLMINAEYEDEDIKRVNNETSNSEDKTAIKRKGLSHEEILAQSLLFFLAGYETTANTLSLFGYCLAINPDVQERLIKEIDEVMKENNQVSYDVLKKMPYLDMCFCEVLRLYPAAARSDRVAKDDIVINGLLIPKGTVIGIPIYGIQTDPELWPNPEKFDPERFSAESKEARDQFAYLPFGIGPRNCVGMRLALTELKMAAACILQKLKFVVCEETQIPLKIQKLKMQGVNGIKIRMERR